DADETAGLVVRRLRKHGVGAGFIPGAARAERGRAPVRVDADAALDQAADSGPLMAMLVGAAAGRKGNAVAAHQQLTLRQCLEKRGEFFMGGHAGRVGGCAALVTARELPTPAGNAAGTRLHGDRRLALPGFALVQRGAGDFGRAVHDENEARQWRQPELDVLGTGEHIFIQPHRWMHSTPLSHAARNSSIAAAVASGFSSVRKWPESIGLPAAPGAHFFQISSGPPVSLAMPTPPHSARSGQSIVLPVLRSTSSLVKSA